MVFAFAAVHKHSFSLPHNCGICDLPSAASAAGMISREASSFSMIIQPHTVSLGTARISTVLFGPLNRHLGGRRFHNHEEVETVICER
jgi:hypothetical protein